MRKRKEAKELCKCDNPRSYNSFVYWRVHSSSRSRCCRLCVDGRSRSACHIIRWAEVAGLIETLLQRFMHSLAHLYELCCECAFLRLNGWPVGRSDGDCAWPISSSSLIFDANWRSLSVPAWAQKWNAWWPHTTAGIALITIIITVFIAKL